MPEPTTSIGPGPAYIRPELRDLRVISVEEHVQFPQPLDQFPETSEVAHVQKNLAQILSHPSLSYSKPRGSDTGAQRLLDMDDGQIAVQILSFGSPLNSTFASSAEEGSKMAQWINDELKKAVDANPARFKALAELPFQAPEMAIRELRRCAEMGFVGAMLSGSIGGDGTFLDGPQFKDLLCEFEALRMPLYLHPGFPPKSVSDIYYNIDGKDLASGMLASGAWGWHSEIGAHVLRLAASGVLDAHPNLKIIIGHQGEMLPFMMQRLDTALDEKALGLQRSVGEALRSQVWIAMSGLFTIPVTLLSIQTWGIDHVLFAVDYPYVDTQRVPEFIKAMNDVVAPSDMRKIFQTNAEKLFGL